MSAAVKAVDKELAELEASPRKPEEEAYIQGCLAAASEEEKAHLSELDLLTVVRGYSTYDPRMEETVKAFTAINEWRKKVDYYHYFDQRIDDDEKFYQYWEEKIYGEDQYGHPIVVMHVKDIDVQQIAEMDTDHMLRLQGQKQALYSRYKEKRSKANGTQRYKYSLIIDLKGTGLNLLGGKRKAVLQQVFSVGADYFPESIWKIYTINTPLLFRGVWTMVKPWIHPITQAKVNMFGTAAAAVKQMQADGVPLEAMPDFMGGGAKPLATFDLLQQEIRDQQAKNAAQGLDAAVDSPAAEAPASGAHSVNDEQIGHLASV
eukprot:TRINITY_DN9354_c0_g1_i1.p1 TRINITY_DN9354_c0_g1~~TRINITY_DN9354_c0_g1_i1.p1  ORF type:complete len:318 (+),score=111.79 TRINITY_DN9354_c0_g1_i1:77-1030(+)